MAERPRAPWWSVFVIGAAMYFGTEPALRYLEDNGYIGNKQTYTRPIVAKPQPVVAEPNGVEEAIDEYWLSQGECLDPEGPSCACDLADYFKDKNERRYRQLTVDCEEWRGNWHTLIKVGTPLVETTTDKIDRIELLYSLAYAHGMVGEVEKATPYAIESFNLSDELGRKVKKGWESKFQTHHDLPHTWAPEFGISHQKRERLADILNRASKGQL